MFMDYFTLQPLLVITLGYGVIAIILGGLIYNLYRRWHSVFQTNPKTQSGAVEETIARLARAEGGLAALEPRVRALEKIGSVAVQKIGFLRFNPFEHTGGDQSFAVALLDRNNNGLVLSSLYTREGVRIYAKEIQGGISQHALSEEEKAVLRQAMENP
ncbi:MAG: DUF4446 family protein [Candidatus Sungbacteria bacterium]|uniref:DUF4446 family protein n=1 Tax=Candidatus Sungiibacteriota bacterium TaxID=2750080 RepID=A0A933DTK8_9BACT|nr:DUF4446 family protein [Candidatus Sungbacteria bacterium]